MNKTEKIDKVGHTSSEQSTLGAENFGRTRMETYVSRACEEKIFRIQERMAPASLTGAHGAITAFTGFL